MASPWCWVALALAVLLLIFVLLYIGALVLMISPSQCPSVLGTYGVKPNTSATILTTCSGGTCVFPAISLQTAVDVCDQDYSRCQAFAYIPGSQVMYYVDPTQAIPQVNSDLYQRQVTISSL